jgi:hypothetical protein
VTSIYADSGGPGLLTVRDADVDNTAQACKTTGGRLYGYHVQNPNASDAWIQFYNLATTAVTVGSTVPKLSFIVPANGAVEAYMSAPFEFDTAITYAATTTAAGGTDPTVGLVGNFFYR